MQYELVIDDDVGQTTVVPLVWDEVRIGRQKGNTIRLTERNVSRSHARLRREGGALRIEDLASYTGVRVNGQRIEGDTPLQVGDRVQIGDYRLSLRLARAATLAREAAEPPKTKEEAKGEGTPETRAAGGETTRLSLAAPAPEPTAVVANQRGAATAPTPTQRTRATTPTAGTAPTPTLMTTPVVAPPVRVLPTPPARTRRRSAVLVSAVLATLALAGGVALWDPAERAPAVESPAEPTPPVQAQGSGAALVKREPEPPAAPPTAPPAAPAATGARPRRASEPTGRAAPLAHPRGARPPAAQPTPSEPPPPQESALSQEEAEALLAQTQVHYVNGEFAQAIKLAQKLTRSQGGVVSARAYRLLGAAACNQGALELVNSAYRRLDVQSRQYVMYVCQQAGVSFNGVSFARLP